MYFFVIAVNPRRIRFKFMCKCDARRKRRWRFDMPINDFILLSGIYSGERFIASIIGT